MTAAWQKPGVPWGDPTFELLLAHCSEFSTIDIDLHAACVAEVVQNARTHNATMAPPKNRSAA